MGIVAEVIACNTRKPLWGYKSLVYSVLAIGFLSFIVWAHHMYLTGMGTRISTFFQTTTMIISIPSVIILTCLFLSLWGGSIRFNTPMLFALSFLPMFGIGGVTGIPANIIGMNVQISHAAWMLGLAQIPFILNFFISMARGKKVPSDNPWEATTIEWQTPTPPPHGNFDKPVAAHRPPYEYSVPGHATDFVPQSQA